MNTRKVPLKVEINGEKKIIGEAVVDTADGYLDVSATVTDPEWRKKLSQDAFFSLHFTPGVGWEDLSMVPQDTGLHIKGRVIEPYVKFADGSIHHASRKQRREGR